MNINPETDLDLEKLFLPAWAQEPSSTNRYAKYAGEDRPSEPQRGDRRGPSRPPRPRGSGGGRPPGPAGREDRRPGLERPGNRGPQRDERRPSLPRAQETREPLPLPEISVSILPDERGVDSLARQIKMTGRAYPLFDIARIILQKPDRFSVRFNVVKNPEGQPVQRLFLCALDETLWLSEDEAVSHVLRNHFATFYQAERTATEPPKGKYTFVAQCGLSGVIFGPPNHHDYQNQLRKLHGERFSRMPFEVYKSRVRIVRDEEVVKKWVEEQSWKTEYSCLNVPEPIKLATRDDVEQHFRATHKDTIIKPVETHALIGQSARNMRCQGLARLARQVNEDQRRFPLQLATLLSQQFASRGLQFFKVNKTITHVSVARPSYLDLETTPVSEGIRLIVQYINAHPRCTRRALLETLAPAASVTAPKPVTSAPQTETAAPVASAVAQPPAAAAEPTAEQTAVSADLHWLVHQGHVIEFANGMLDAAKKPLPRPIKPVAPSAPAKAEVAPAERATPIVGTVETPPGDFAGPAETPASAESLPASTIESADAIPPQTEPQLPTNPIATDAGIPPSEAQSAAVTEEPAALPVAAPPGETPPAAG